MKKLFNISVGLACLAVVGFLVAPKLFSSEGASQEAGKKTAAPIVRTELQLESPLKIVITSINSTDPLKPTIEYLLSNDGQKIVRAYTVRYDFTTSHSSFVAHECSVIRSRNSYLRPEQTTHGVVDGHGSSEPVTEVKLSVDVVEFDDGEFWGTDSTKTRDMISGMHSGVSMAVNFYQQKRKLVTLEKMTENLKAGTEQELLSYFPPSQDKSAEWSKGYQTGLASVRARLARAGEDHGAEEIDKELRQAASEIKRR